MLHEEAYRDILAALEIVALQLELLRAAPEEAIPLVHRAREIARRLQFWMESGEKDLRILDREAAAGVPFSRRRPLMCRSCSMRSYSTPIDTAVLTSATLAVAGEFEFTKQRLGLRNARTLVVESHFDYTTAGPAVRPAGDA